MTAAFPSESDVARRVFMEDLTRLLRGERRLALAVSGGGDSAAMLLLAVSARAALKLDLFVATVDHGLRPGSRAEAERVAALCEELDAPHSILTWDGPKPVADVQAAARAARRRLLAAWRRDVGAPVLALGHTRDDVAETFLMRLARGSGVDGLARMAEHFEERAEDGAPLRTIRPLLRLRRDALRAVCRAAGRSWEEDPSNAEPRFLRARARAALGALEALDLGVERLARTAETLARARSALENEAAALLRRAGEAAPELGLLRLDAPPLRAAPRELALRALARALEWAAGAAYPPRLDALEAALDAVLTRGAGRSLHGALLAPERGDRWTVAREPAATAPRISIASQKVASQEMTSQEMTSREMTSRETARAALSAGIWDGRFIARRADDADRLMVGALGESGRLAVERRLAEDGIDPPQVWRAAPLAARRAAPALFSPDGTILAAPAAGLVSPRGALSPLRTGPWEPHMDLTSV